MIGSMMGTMTASAGVGSRRSTPASVRSTQVAAGACTTERRAGVVGGTVGHGPAVAAGCRRTSQRHGAAAMARRTSQTQMSGRKRMGITAGMEDTVAERQPSSKTALHTGIHSTRGAGRSLMRPWRKPTCSTRAHRTAVRSAWSAGLVVMALASGQAGSCSTGSSTCNRAMRRSGTRLMRAPRMVGASGTMRPSGTCSRSVVGAHSRASGGSTKRARRRATQRTSTAGTTRPTIRGACPPPCACGRDLQRGLGRGMHMCMGMGAA